MFRGGGVTVAVSFLGGRTTELAVGKEISSFPTPPPLVSRPPPLVSKPPPLVSKPPPLVSKPPPARSLPVAPICRRSIFNQSLYPRSAGEALFCPSKLLSRETADQGMGIVWLEFGGGGVGPS